MTSIYSDENLRDLNERLGAADELVKQHIKVAEEAISGWEKDKSEYMSLKNQLEVVLEQKQATEDIISHLDGALKVCMQDLRHLREEQEEKIHEAIIKKTRDCENIRLELEEKLRDVSGELAAASYENAQLLNIVREQSDTISETERARSQFEELVVTLQVHIGTLEKENASLKYEIITLNKELVICNQEKEINRRSGKTFRKQHLDDIKKIDKLDTECQRLKNLVQKKIPCPGALVQMKQETDCLDAEKSETMNKKFRSNMGFRRGVSSPKSVHSESFFRPERLLRDQGFTMEEIKTSKEALAKKSNELQAVKLVNSWPTDKLAMFGRQPQSSPRRASSLICHVNDALDSPISRGCRQDLSQASISEDGYDDERSIADSWASMLVTELTEFQKEKAALEQSTKSKDLVWLDTTDDFVEMERLASLSSAQEDRSDCGKANPMPSIAQVANISVAHKDCIPSSLDTGKKALKTSPELMSAVCELMWLVEEMALEALAQSDTCSVVKDGNPNNVSSISPFELGLNPKNFTSVGYKFLHGEMELLHFIAELSSALGQIKTINIRNATIVRKFKEAPFSLGFREYTGGQEPQGFTSELSSVSVQGTVEPDVSSDATISLLTNASNSDSSEDNVATKCFIASNEKVASSRGHQNNDEVRKLRAEKAALESHMRAEFSRIDMMEQMLVEIKQEKSDLQDVIRQEKEKVEAVKRELSNAEQLIESLRGKLSSVELSRDLTRERLQSSEALNGMLDSLVKESQLESTQMAEKMESLRFETIQMTTKMRSLEQTINEEQARNKALEVKLEELQESLERANANLLQNEAVPVAAKIDEVIK